MPYVRSAGTCPSGWMLFARVGEAKGSRGQEGEQHHRIRYQCHAPTPEHPAQPPSPAHHTSMQRALCHSPSPVASPPVPSRAGALDPSSGGQPGCEPPTRLPRDQVPIPSRTAPRHFTLRCRAHVPMLQAVELPAGVADLDAGLHAGKPACWRLTTSPEIAPPETRIPTMLRIHTRHTHGTGIRAPGRTHCCPACQCPREDVQTDHHPANRCFQHQRRC